MVYAISPPLVNIITFCSTLYLYDKYCLSVFIYSLPITYGITLHELGVEQVHKYQGREPSGRKMDDIALDYNSTIRDTIKYKKFKSLA